MKHQINEEMLGTDATPEQAQAMAERLTALGYPSEYNAAQGIGLRQPNDPETGEPIEIPDGIWFDCLPADDWQERREAFRNEGEIDP